MRKTYLCVAALSGLILAGCDTAVAPENRPEEKNSEAGVADRAPDEAAAVTGEHRFASWAGRWNGVEGMYVDIRPRTAETYELEMQYDLDNAGVFAGRDSEHGIKFTRNGEELSLRRGNGGDTGLKYLDNKQECLIVKDGEGYCRD